MSQVSEDHSAQTKAKQEEQRILAGPPPTGIGRRCAICLENKWKREFYAHMDRHLDDMNRGETLKEIRSLPELEIKNSLVSNG